MSEPTDSPPPRPDWHRDWRRWHGGDGPPWHGPWPRRGRFLFLRFAAVFGAMALLIVAGMAIVAYLLSRLTGGDHQTVMLVWIGGCGLALVLPLLALFLGLRTFRRVALPLADVMAAAEAVAAGNLQVRVPERGSRDFQRLSQAFNHMTAELERIDQQRRNLTADVAHELRTPLHIIQGNLEGILDGVYPATPEHIEATLEETRQLARLIDDLRTLSLVESGQLPLVREPVNLADLLADVATSFSGQAEAAQVAIQVVDGAGLRILGDAGRLDQVLSNLVANALRHTPADGTITLTASRQAEQALITVADTGVGIAPADLPHIFDRFWRGDRARTHSAGVGSGLGLSIANQLIKAHGGSIQVSSEVGKGTAFVITLPCA